MNDATTKPRKRNTRTDRIRRLTMKGELTPRQIAIKVGSTPSHVYVTRWNMQKEGMVLPPIPQVARPEPKAKPKPKTAAKPKVTPSPVGTGIAALSVSSNDVESTSHNVALTPYAPVITHQEKHRGFLGRLFDRIFRS